MSSDLNGLSRNIKILENLNKYDYDLFKEYNSTLKQFYAWSARQNNCLKWKEPSMGVAIVTGAQRGMGKAIALALAIDGFDVAVVDLELTPALQAVAAEVASKGVKSIALACDIGNLDQHQTMLSAAVAGCPTSSIWPW